MKIRTPTLPQPFDQFGCRRFRYITTSAQEVDVPYLIKTDSAVAALRVRGKPVLAWVFWATVCKTVHPMLSVRCLSVCLSSLCVTFVHCGQTVGRIKTKLGMLVGLSPGDFVLDGNPVPFPPKGADPSSPIFGPFLLWPNGWMHQDATWYGCWP